MHCSLFRLSHSSHPHTLTLHPLNAQLLQSKQAIEVLEQRDARRADLEANHVLSLVPRSFDIVRGIFGERGLCVKPRDEVRYLRLAAYSGLLIPKARGVLVVPVLLG